MNIMEIETIIVGPFEVNCYLVYEMDEKTGVIIDPGGDEEVIIRRIEKAGFTPKAIFLTHGHGDHIAAVGALKAKYNVPLYVGAGGGSLQPPSQDLLSATPPEGQTQNAGNHRRYEKTTPYDSGYP